MHGQFDVVVQHPEQGVLDDDDDGLPGVAGADAEALLLEPDRRLFHRLADEITTGCARSRQRAVPSRCVAGCVVHSDRGSQFRSRKFLRALARHGLVGSMGRVASAGDNAAMESFFALLQNNVPDRRSRPDREELQIAIVTWIERIYHRRRRQTCLGRLTPIEYETIMTAPASRAAWPNLSPDRAAVPTSPTAQAHERAIFRPIHPGLHVREQVRAPSHSGKTLAPENRARTRTATAMRVSGNGIHTPSPDFDPVDLRWLVWELLRLPRLQFDHVTIDVVEPHGVVTRVSLVDHPVGIVLCSGIRVTVHTIAACIM